MSDNEIAEKLYDTLKIKLGREAHTHTEIISMAKNISIFVYDCSDDTIIENVVIRYEENHPLVRVTSPDVLVANEDDGKWFERKRDILKHSLTDGYFDRYKRYLRREDFSEAVNEQMEEDCSRVLKQCANPDMSLDVNERKKKGLVVGDVQSGKTSNYLGLINMACDYGYKIIVLLAGLTDFLRQQTQSRIDYGFIGAVSDTIGDVEITYVGVNDDAQLQQHYAVPLTNNENDFVKFVKKNLNATSGDFNKPIVLVAKKNGSVLKQVVDWLKPGFHNINCQNVLIIDDEADNASINTKKPDCNPSTINGYIRDLFNNFPIASYVGYTATPFAKVFDNPEGDESFKDLFPSDFIVLLNPPSNYYGAEKVFAYEGKKHSRHLRLTDEAEPNFLPVKYKKDECHHFTALPKSMKESILCFVINNVVRTIRGATKKHRSMLINISVYNDMHDEILYTVQQYVNCLRNVIEQDYYKDSEDFIKNEDMRMLYGIYMGLEEYQSDGCDFYEEIREKISWEEIKVGLYDEISKFEAVVINNKNKKDRFSYSADRFKDVGARVIIIGGYVLSRGLTLEGLMVSYFSRNSSAYDSLLQMCRWFGYRPNYEDLCRIYISPINVMNFRAVIDAVDDLKMQFREMIVKKKKPSDFGLMIKESPDTLETSLLITSRNKMYNTGEVVHVINYGGTYADTSKIFCSAKINEANSQVIAALINEITGESAIGWTDFCPDDRFPNRTRKMLLNVNSAIISTYIKKLKVPFENTKFDVDNLSRYISESKSFPMWDIVIASGESKSVTYNTIPAVMRSFRIRDNILRIGDTNNRIIDPGVFSSGLSPAQISIAKAHATNRIKHAENETSDGLTVPDYLSVPTRNPLFVIYPLELKVPKENNHAEIEAKDRFPEGTAVLGFAIGFPAKESAEKMKYRANKVKIKEIEESRSDPEVDEEFGDNE